MLQHVEDNINARLTLASLLLEEARDEEAISLLSPPKDSSMCSLNNYHVLYHLQVKRWMELAGVSCNAYQRILGTYDFMQTQLAHLPAN